MLLTSKCTVRTLNVNSAHWGGTEVKKKKEKKDWSQIHTVKGHPSFLLFMCRYWEDGGGDGGWERWPGNISFVHEWKLCPLAGLYSGTITDVPVRGGLTWISCLPCLRFFLLNQQKFLPEAEATYLVQNNSAGTHSIIIIVLLLSIMIGHLQWSIEYNEHIEQRTIVGVLMCIESETLLVHISDPF